MALGIVPAASGSVSCALYRNDRCYVDDLQYKVAYNLFVESGSLRLVMEDLEKFQWSRCKINEVAYRLEKEFGLSRS